MSWAKDEWKQNLPPNALQKVNALEDEVEGLRKAKQQQVCQYEGLQAAFQKQKQMNEEERTTSSTLTQEIQELLQKCAELEGQTERLKSELKTKAQKNYLLEDQVQRAKQKTAEDNEEILSLRREMSVKENELRRSAEKHSQLSAEFDRTKQANVQLAKDVEAFSAKIKDLSAQNESFRDQLFQRVGKPNVAANDHRDHGGQDSENTASVFLEMMKKEKDALVSENGHLKKDKELVKRSLEEKERELEKVGEKLAATSTELEAKTKAFTAKEKEVKKLRGQLDGKENGQGLEVKIQKLIQELECLKRNHATAEDTIACLSEERDAARSTIKSMETELEKKATVIERRRERAEELGREKQALVEQLERLTKGNEEMQGAPSTEAENEEFQATIGKLKAELRNAAKMIEEKNERTQVLEDEALGLEKKLAYLVAELENRANLVDEKDKCIEMLEKGEVELSEELSSLKQQLLEKEIQASKDLTGKESIITRLEADADEKAQEAREQLERVERLLTENARLGAELEAARRQHEEVCVSYDAVARALNESRALAEGAAMRLRLDRPEQDGQKSQHEVDGEGARPDEVKAAKLISKQSQRPGTNTQVTEQQRIRGGAPVLRCDVPEAGEESNSERRVQTQGNPEPLKSLLSRLQEDHEMMEARARECLRSLHETCDLIGDQADEDDDEPEIVTRLRELRTSLESLLQAASHCRLMVCPERPDNGATVLKAAQPTPEKDADADTAQHSREGSAPQSRDGYEDNGDLSWDDYDKEEVFQTFRNDVDFIVQQLEKGSKAVKRKANGECEVRRARDALQEIKRKSQQSCVGTRNEGNQERSVGRQAKLQFASGGADVAERPYEEHNQKKCQAEAGQPLEDVPSQTTIREQCGVQRCDQERRNIPSSRSVDLVSRQSKEPRPRQREAERARGGPAKGGSKRRTDRHTRQARTFRDEEAVQLAESGVRASKGRTCWESDALEKPSRPAEVEERYGRHAGERGTLGTIGPDELVEVVQVTLEECNLRWERTLAENFGRLQETLQGQRFVMQQTEEGEEKEVVGGHVRSALDGRYAVSELEISRKKLAGVQKNIKELIAGLVATQRENEALRGCVERLERELQERESRHEEECAELKNVVRCASQQETALKRRVKTLDADKEELNNELRQVIEKLKQKELELVGQSKKLRDLQARATDEEATLRKNNEALQADNDALWEDYREANKQAERREADVRGIMQNLKTSEAQLIAIFHRLRNVDEDVRRARDRQVYD